MKTENKYYGIPKDKIFDEWILTTRADTEWIEKAKQNSMAWSKKHYFNIKNDSLYNLNNISIRKIRVWKDVKDLIYLPTQSYRKWSGNTYTIECCYKV